MSINIGDNNKIKNSTFAENTNIENEKKGRILELRVNKYHIRLIMENIRLDIFWGDNYFYSLCFY